MKSLTLIQVLAALVSTVAADIVSTYTLGPRSAYILTAPDAATPTGQDFRLFVPNDHPGHIGIYMSDKFKGNVNSTLEGCPKDDSTKCHGAIADLINAQDAPLQARSLAAAAVAVGSLANFIWVEISIIVSTISYLFETDPMRDHVVIAPSNWATKQETASPIGTLVLATAADDKQPATAVYTPPATTTGPGPVISTATDASHSGDVIITLPTQLARLTEDLVGMYTCSASSKERRDGGMSCVIDGAQNLLANAAPGGPLHDLEALQVTQPIVDHFAVAELQAAFETLLAWTQAIAIFAFNSHTVMQAVVAVALWLSYKHHVLGWIGNVINTIPAKFIGGSSTPTEEGDSCPTPGVDGTKPVCDECNGDSKNQCTTGIHKGCDCNWAYWAYSQPGQLSDWEFLNGVMEKWMNGTWYPHPTCAVGSNKILTIDNSLWQSIKTVACKDKEANLTLPFNLNFPTSVSSGAASYSDFVAWTYDFDWIPGDWDHSEKCSQTCDQIFEEFINDKTCTPDAKSMMSGGSLQLPCGQASYKINPAAPPPPKPDPTPSNIPTQPMDCYQLEYGVNRNQWNMPGAAASMEDFCVGNKDHYLSAGDTNWFNSTRNPSTVRLNNGQWSWVFYKYTASWNGTCQSKGPQQVGSDVGGSCYGVLNYLIGKAARGCGAKWPPGGDRFHQDGVGTQSICLRYSLEMVTDGGKNCPGCSFS